MLHQQTQNVSKLHSRLSNTAWKEAFIIIIIIIYCRIKGALWVLVCVHIMDVFLNELDFMVVWSHFALIGAMASLLNPFHMVSNGRPKLIHLQ